MSLCNKLKYKKIQTRNDGSPYQCSPNTTVITQAPGVSYNTDFWSERNEM